jgi:hypothetical protein
MTLVLNSAVVVVGLLGSASLSPQAGCRRERTAEFAVSDIAVVKGVVQTRAGEAVPGAFVYAHFQDIRGGISSNPARTDRAGVFVLPLEVYGRGGDIPESFDSLSAYIIASLPDSEVNAQPVQDSIATYIRFAAAGSRPPVTEITISLPID